MTPQQPNPIAPEDPRYGALRAVSTAIASQPSLQIMLDSISVLLAKVVPLESISLLLVDEKHRVVKRYARHPNIEIGSEWSYTGTASGEAIEKNKPVFVENIQATLDNFPDLQARLKSDSIHSVYVFPVATPRRKLGTLVFGTSEQKAFAPADVDLMSSVASHVSVALASALAVEAANEYQVELARERDRLKLLLEINNHVVSQLEVNDFFHAASVSIRKFFGSDLIGFWLFDESSKRFRCATLDFLGEQKLSANVPTPEFTETDVVGGHSRALVIETLDEVARRFPLEFTAALREGSIASFVRVPLVSVRGPVGVLLLGSQRANTFSQEDMDLLIQVATQISLALDNVLMYGRLNATRNRLDEERIYLESEIRSEYGFEDIVGKSTALRKVLNQVAIVAPTDSTVLLHGETGTGKELIARAIHNLSSRRHRTFIKLNCSAIPSGLVESELFGHEKGAFTGALAQKRGRFELAHEGSLFLDEIGDISLELQPKLLRAIQEQEFERLGSTRTIRVDVRLIAATHRDLGEMIRKDQFREDLFYRLNVFPIEIPPLRERREDIPLLVHYFVVKLTGRMRKRITVIPKQAMDALTNWDWPGNIRELANFIERAVILTQGNTLNVPFRELKAFKKIPSRSRSVFPETEKETIVTALRAANGRIAGKGGAADRLGLKRTTLQNKMRRLAIARIDYTAPESTEEHSGDVLRGKPSDFPPDKSSTPGADASASQSPTRDEIVRIVTETISKISQGASQSAVRQHDERQRQQIMRVLTETRGRVGGPDGAAARIGINRTTLLSRMKKFGIDRTQFS